MNWRNSSTIQGGNTTWKKITKDRGKIAWWTLNSERTRHCGPTYLASIRKRSRSTKPMIRYLLSPSQTGCERVSFCFPYTKMTRKPCRKYFTGPPSTWMLRTRCQLGKRNRKEGKGRTISNKNKGARGPGRETGEMNVAPNLQEEDLRASPR